MKTNRIIVILFAVSITLQAINLFRGPSSARPGKRQTAAELVIDAPEGVVIDLAGLPVEGSSTSAIVLVEFSDYECPFCSRHAQGAGKKIREELVETGKIRHAFANNPLQMHKSARLLAAAAICSGQQAQYWKMYDQLFAFKPTTIGEIHDITKSLELNVQTFDECMTSENTESIIQKDMAKARELRLTGTPGFAIGQLDDNGVVHVQKLITGAAPLQIFKKVIDGVSGAKA